MATRNIYDDIYGLGSQVTNISTVAAATKGIALSNHPDLNNGTNTISQRKATGLSYIRTDTGFERQVGTEMPTSGPWEFDVHIKSLARILWSFYQTSAFQGASSVYPKYFIPYETTTCDVWLSLVRKLAASGDANSHQINGAICNTFTLSSEEGQTLKCSAGFIGYDWAKRDIASDTLTFDASAPLLWQNATITLGGTAVNIPSFSLTVNNGAIAKAFDAKNPIKHILNEFTAEGTIRVPWSADTVGGNTEIDNFVAGTPARLVIYWGNDAFAEDDSAMSIIANIRMTSVTPAGDDEVMVDIAFECVSTLTQSSISVASSSISIAAAATTTCTGSSTTFTSFAAGDLLYPFGLTAAGDKTIRIITAVGGNTSLTIYPAFTAATEGTKNYFVRNTPLTIVVGDSQSISGM
jgi:hypothetical protein